MRGAEQPPASLTRALAELWRSGSVTPDRLFSARAFVHLRETCQKLYPNAGSGFDLDCALSNALSALGMRNGTSSRDVGFALPIEVATARLDAAFRLSRSTRIHLCPLDCSDDLPTLSFGPNKVQRMSQSQLETIVDSQRLKRINPAWNFEAERFSEFTWLVVEEVVPLDREPGERAVPLIYETLQQDFGRIEPHVERFPTAVETALFALLLAPWEDWTTYPDVQWRSFRVPWVYTANDDIFVRPAPPPSPDTLSWQPRTYINRYGEEVEEDCAECWQLSEDAQGAPSCVNNDSWADLMSARQSPLFGSPIGHFLVHAFLTEGIDEFLGHITTIEAALGLSVDHDVRNRSRLAGDKNPGATARVAARFSALLKKRSAKDDFLRLFRLRSDFIHGRTMSPIPGQDRVLARRLAREAVVALARAALMSPPPSSRNEYLDNLLSAGAAYV